MKKLIVASIGILIILISCSNESPEFAGDWELRKMEFGGKTIDGVSMESPVYSFYANGKYKISVLNSDQLGKWEMDGKRLILVDPKDNNVKSEASIVKVDDKEFIYTIKGANNTQTTVYLDKLPTSD